MTLEEWQSLQPGQTIYSIKSGKAREIIRFNIQSKCATLKPVNKCAFSKDETVYSKSERRLFSLVKEDKNV